MLRYLCRRQLCSWHLASFRPTITHYNFRPFSSVNNNEQYECIKNDLIDILRKIDHPSGVNEDIVYLGLIRNIKVSEKEENSANYVISIDLELDRHYRALKKIMAETIQNEMSSKMNIESIRINMAEKNTSTSSRDNPLKNVKNIIAVSSCKGGVGKSSIAVNLAYTLSKMDYRVGIFDADIYGPSLPTMTSANSSDKKLRQNEETQLIYPVMYEGVKLMSFGFYNPSSPSSSGLAAMRGPMVTNVIQQLLFQTNWGDLDYLIIDFPPGTSDIHLTLTQKLSITASVVITTPQLLSMIDVAKGIEMWNKVNVPTVALIKNMTYYICNNCGSKQDIFNNESKKVSNSNGFIEDFGINKVYEMPIYPLLSQFSDYGDPIVLNNDTFINETFDAIASGVIEEINRINAEKSESCQWSIDNEKSSIKFVNNSEEFQIHFVDLRFLCKCALCVDEMTNTQILKREDIDKNIKIGHIEACGNYAVRIIWADKHESLIPFDSIRENASE